MKIVTLDNSSVDSYDHCLMKNRKLPGYIAKTEWIKSQLKKGLVTKRMLSDDGRAVGFIEYTPIENAWRAVSGKNYLFIHCIFTYPKAFQGKQVGADLVKECIKEAKKSKKEGVAVVTSKGSFIADQRLFEKLGFEEVEELHKHQLMILRFKPKSPAPKFKDIDSKLKKVKGLNLFYTDQCPALAKPVAEIIEACKRQKIKLKLHYFRTPKEAQSAPFVSGTFAVVFDGKIYSERVISKTRFLNIAKQVGLI